MAKAPKATTFSSRSNAKRAAEKAIADGTAASIDYGIKEHASGRFQIAWKTAPATTEAVETEIATATAEAETAETAETAEAETPEAETVAHIIATGDETLGEVKPLPTEKPTEEENDAAPQPEADPFPKGARVRVRGRKNRANGTTFTGTIDYRVDATFYRVFVDGARGGSALYRIVDISPSNAPPALPVAPTGKPERKPRAAPSGDRKPSKAAELDAQAATGAMPTKPIMTSKANPHYQKRFDQLEKWALADDWDAIRGYEVKGINSYAKMVAAYRDRLLAAHAASITTEGAS